MKRKLLGIILALAMLFALAGCDEKNNSEYIDETAFVCVSTGNIYVYVHKETRVMYAVYKAYYRGGMTIMLDADGKPLIWEGEL